MYMFKTTDNILHAYIQLMVQSFGFDFRWPWTCGCGNDRRGQGQAGGGVSKDSVQSQADSGDVPAHVLFTKKWGSVSSL